MLEKLRSSLSAVQARMIDLFHSWDDDGSGDITLLEFNRALQAMGMAPAPYQVAPLLEPYLSPISPLHLPTSPYTSPISRPPGHRALRVLRPRQLGIHRLQVHLLPR